MVGWGLGSGNYFARNFIYLSQRLIWLSFLDSLKENLKEAQAHKINIMRILWYLFLEKEEKKYHICVVIFKNIKKKLYFY